MFAGFALQIADSVLGYNHSNTVNHKPLHFRIALILCLCTALWFALGGVIKVLIAKSSGKTIEMVVCSGAGIKKIYVQVSGLEHASSEVSLKHCSNTPMALATKEWSTLEHLAYVAPDTSSVIALAPSAPVHRSWVRDGRPPPGRAPPSSFLS